MAKVKVALQIDGVSIIETNTLRALAPGNSQFGRKWIGTTIAISLRVIKE